MMVTTWTNNWTFSCLAWFFIPLGRPLSSGDFFSHRLPRVQPGRTCVTPKRSSSVRSETVKRGSRRFFGVWMDVYFFWLVLISEKICFMCVWRVVKRMKQDMEVDDVYMQVPKSPGESAFAGGKRPQRRSFRAWGLDPHETHCTIFCVWENRQDTFFLGKLTPWRFMLPGFLRKKRLSTERFPGLWTGIGGPFGWLALIDMLMKKLAVNFIPDTSLIPRKTSLVPDWRIWLQLEIVLESSDEASATQHGSMMWFSKMLLGCFTMPYWTPENLLYCKVGSTFLPNPPHLPWVVICQTIKNCINFYLRCKFRSWILMEPAWEESLLFYSQTPQKPSSRKSRSPQTRKAEDPCRLLSASTWRPEPVS